MSTDLAYARPAISPLQVEEHPRHIEIVASRRQRRARPKLVYAIIAVGGLFVILIVQLLLSIMLSNGTYQISALQSTQKELSRDQETLTESLHVLESPQNLVTRAQQLGMVMNSSSAGWLRLSDGAVLQAPSAAGAGTDATGGGLIPNALLTPDMTADGTVAAGGGAPETPTSTSSVASDPGALPAPITH